MSKFRPYLQRDSMDCGPTCLRMVAKYYGCDFSPEVLRDKCSINREGVSLLGISDAAESIGFRTMGVKVGWDQLCSDVPFPCLVHWNQHHFIVIYEIVKKRNNYVVKIADPAHGLLSYNREEFIRYWLDQDRDLGVALLLEPTPRLFSDHKIIEQKIGFRFVFTYLYPYRTCIIVMLLAMGMASLISFAMPLFTQAIVDKGIRHGSMPLITLLLIAQFILTLGGLANGFIRNWLMLHVTSRVSLSFLSDFFNKLMRLPISFFDSRTVGDIMQRTSDYGKIQRFLTGEFLGMAVAIVSFLVYCAVMSGYNIKILIVFIIGTILYIVWVLAFLKRRRKLDYMRFQQSSANQNSIVQLINGMRDIKINGCERRMRWGWESIQTRLFRINVKGLSLGQMQELGCTLIDQTKNMFVSFVAAKSVVDGNMTLGMMMALQYIIGQMNAPVSRIISFAQTAQEASISLDRLGEIQKMKDEDGDKSGRLPNIPLNSNIQFVHVTFQYDGSHSYKVLDRINLMIPVGKITAIVGASGSGKTTMLKMMLGFHVPTEGAILLGGEPIGNYSEKQWRERCGVVLQDSFIFSDSIAANIALSDEYPDLKRVREAAAIACISEWIEALPLGYNTRIGADGHGLSIGQKQRILIARAVYKKADYLFFDEATNALDTNTEKLITRNLNKLFLGKTVVIVAHRLSTVKNADNIVVLDKGKIVETGTHADLVACRGAYYKLIKNQLELGG
uniref:peptidase domain-containing ABC transporter n=1 Tax=Candidatus Cryptobacteroides bacterium TaxID=3085639 RepID=UPI004027B477